MSPRIASLAIVIITLSLLAIHGQAQDILSVPQTSLIAFTSDLDGQADIYTLDSEGNHRRRLTNTPEWERDLLWSPDSRHLAFISSHYDPVANEYTDTLFVMQADGSHLRALANVSNSQPNLRWLSDSQRLMFDLLDTESFLRSTALIDINEPDIMRTLGEGYDYHHIVSPDLTHIAYIHRSRRIYGGPDLYVMQADGTHKTRVMTDVREAFWLPNSQELAYIHETKNQYYLSILNRDGSDLRRIPIPFMSQFKWSPDHTQLLFGGQNLYIVNADGTGLHRLTTFALGLIETYDWSPDGKQVVFSYRFRGDHPHAWPFTSQIYIVSADGAYQRLITHEETMMMVPGETRGYVGSEYPAWQPVPR